MSKATIVLGSILACVSACASAHPADGTAHEAVTRRADQAQMNDVSVLYPLAKTQDEMRGYISASDTGRGGVLLSRDHYLDGITQARLTLTRLDYEDLRATAFRIDPCFANIGPVTDPQSCRAQLRITFQAVTFRDGEASVVDGAVHAFYSLSAAELNDLVREVIALRQRESHQSELGALAVHPILSEQGLLGGEAQGLRNLVLGHAGQSNFIRFTVFTPDAASTMWDFAGFDVHGTDLTPMVIPTLASEATRVTYFAGFSDDLDGRFAPPTSGRDDMQLLGNLGQARAASSAEQQAAFDAALRIENPDKASPETVDCASCHVAGVGRVLTGGQLGLSAEGNPNAFAHDRRLVRDSEMEQTTPVTRDATLNVHMFSYRRTQPMIAARVINETASVVALLNGSVLR